MPMKMTVQKAMDATLVISKIIRDARPMPQTGKFRLALMHAKLLPIFTAANTSRDALIMAYDHHEMIDGPHTETDPLGEVKVPSPEFSVPVDKMPDFIKAWTEFSKDEVEVDIQPIPLKYLDLGDMANGSIEAHELATLGGLISE